MRLTVDLTHEVGEKRVTRSVSYEGDDNILDTITGLDEVGEMLTVLFSKARESMDQER